MWYEGMSKASLPQPQHKTEQESDAFSVWREIGVSVLGSRLSQSRQDSPTAHCVHEHLGVFPSAQTPGKMKNITLQPPWCPSQHPCCCATVGTDRHSTPPMQKNGWNSQFKCPCSFYHLETRFLAISFFSFAPPKVVLWVKLHVQYVWAIKIQRVKLHTRPHAMGPLSRDVFQAEKGETIEKRHSMGQITRGGSVINTCARNHENQKALLKKCWPLQ